MERLYFISWQPSTMKMHIRATISWLEYFIGFSLGYIHIIIMASLMKILPHEMLTSHRVQGYENTMQCL
jgi:hypothetical protein